MEIFRAGEAVLRSSQPILPFLAPWTQRTLSNSPRTAAPIARHCRGQRNPPISSRAFTTSTCRKQPAGAAAAAESRQEDDFDMDWSRLTDNPSPSKNRIGDEITSLLDSTLDGKKGTPSAPASRTSRFSSNKARANNYSGEFGDLDFSSGKSSIDDVLNTMGTPSMPRRGENYPSRGDLDVFQSIDPYNRSGTRGPPKPYEEPAPMKLGPTVGRTVEVNLQRNMDIGRAFRTLEMTCGRNSVRKDMMRQRFHERPGMKRKRLKSERWRKNFKASFSGVVQLVQKMKRQGW